jgi:hypothetical protein
VNRRPLGLFQLHGDGIEYGRCAIIAANARQWRQRRASLWRSRSASLSGERLAPVARGEHSWPVLAATRKLLLVDLFLVCCGMVLLSYIRL